MEKRQASEHDNLFIVKQCTRNLINNMPTSFSTKGFPYFYHQEKPTFSEIIEVFTESIIFNLSFKISMSELSNKAAILVN